MLFSNNQMRPTIGILMAIISIGLAFVLGFTYQPTSPKFPAYRFPKKQSDSHLIESLSLLETQILQSPQDALALSSLSKLLVIKAKLTGDANDYDAAEKSAQKSLKLLPQFNNQAVIVLARIAEARHDFESATKLSKQVIETKVRAEALSILVTSYLAQGKLDDASIWADQLVQDSPGVSTYPLRALVLTARGRDEEAEFDFLKALYLEDVDENDSSAWARALMARFYLRKGHIAWATHLISEASTIVPNYHLALAIQGEIEFEKQQYAKAADLFFQAFLQSRQLSYLRQYANAKERSGKNEEAMETRTETEKLMRKELSEKKYGHRMELALLLLDKANKKDAIEAIQLLQNELMTRKSSEVYHALARGFALAELWNEAKEAVQAALRSGVRDASIDNHAAQIEKHLGNFSKAAFFEGLSHKTSTLGGKSSAQKPIGSQQKNT